MESWFPDIESASTYVDVLYLYDHIRARIIRCREGWLVVERED